MKKLQSISIILIIFCVFSIAQKSPKDHFDFPPLNELKMPQVKMVELGNGMRLFLIEDHDYPTIDIRAMVRVGSVFDPEEKTGLAAITGTVLRTGGTENMTGDVIDKTLETMAASVECGIGVESGHISASMLKEDADKVLAIMADILMHPVFAKEKIELAKVGQISAISRRNDDVGQIARREFRKLIYGKSPYARQAEYATIDAIDRDDLVDFYRAFFLPNNIIMAVWGDFNSEEMTAKLDNIFADWQPSLADVQIPPEVNYQYRYTVNFIEKSDIDQSNIMLGHIGGLMNGPDYPALMVMNRILSFDRMFKHIRTDEGLAYSVWGRYGVSYATPGVFSAGAQTKSTNTVRVIELILGEIKRIMQEKVSDEELKRAKDQYLNSFVFRFDSKAKIVTRMMNYAYYGYPLDFDDSFKQQVQKVTAADVLRVAKRYLIPEKVQILVVGNSKNFDKPLSSLGKVNVIDISIPEPKQEKPELTPPTDEGKKMVREMAAALGGEKKIKAMENFQVNMELTINGMSIKAVWTGIWPNKYHLLMNTPGGEIAMVVNGKHGHISHPGGIAPMPKAQRDEIVNGALRDPYFLVKYLDSFDVRHNGTVKFAKIEAVDLFVSGKDISYHLYLNPDSYLPVGVSYKGSAQTGFAEVIERISHYRQIDGMTFWLKVETSVGGKPISENTIEEIKFNLPLNESMFEIK